MPLSDVLNKFIIDGQPFAFIRLPKEENIFLIFEDKKGKNIYSFASFDSKKKHVFYFSDFVKLTDIEAENKLAIPLYQKENISIISKKDYLNLLQKTIHFLQEKKAEKIVISREKWVNKINIDAVKSFIFLCNKYPNSFCHLSYWNSREIWLGASPEVLGTWDNSIFTTMALAGTLPDEDAESWGKKEFDEQKYVTDYVYEKIKKFSTNISVNGPKTLHLGHLKHLITHFSATLQNPDLFSKLIQSLQPTPAVCGIPLNVSMDFILENEGYNRNFYAGYIGLETQNFKNYYVNLRCSKLYNNGALLYVGGGITSQSDPEKEWKETELKAKFISESL